jgi:hypothetical protein
MLRIDVIETELNMSLKGWMSTALNTQSLLPKELRLTGEDYELRGGDIYLALTGTQKLIYLMAKNMMMNAEDYYSMHKEK